MQAAFLIVLGLSAAEPTSSQPSSLPASQPSSQPSSQPVEPAASQPAAPAGDHPEQDLAEGAAGPALELDGLDLGLTDDAGEVEAGESPEGYDAREDLGLSLADRAAVIVDATTLGGYGEHEFHWGQNEISKFVAHRYVLFVYSKITDRISTATEIEFEFAGSPMKKDDTLQFGEVLLEFSIVDFELFPWLVARAGVILVPFGAFNLRHDAPTRDLTERPIAYTTIVPTTWFESGAGLHGDVELPAGMGLGYEVYVVNGLDARIVDGFGTRAARGSHFEDNNSDKAVVGRLSLSPTLSSEIGLSGYSGAYDLRGRRINMVNLDATWRYAGFELLGEIVGMAADAGYVEGFSASSPANTRDPIPTGMWGFFVQGNYHIRIEPLWQRFPDWLQESVFTAVLRYEGKDTDVDRLSAEGDHRRLTMGLNFRPVEAFVVKSDLQFNSRGVAGVAAADEPWQAGFWDPRGLRLVSSVAFLF